MSPRRTSLALPRLVLALLSITVLLTALPSSVHASPGAGAEPGAAPQLGSSVRRTSEPEALARAEADYRAATERVLLLSEHSAALDARAEQAAAQAEELYATVRTEDGGSLVNTFMDLVDGADSALVRATEAADNAAHAAQLATVAADAVADAIADSEQARILWERKLGRRQQLGVRQAARLAARTAAQQSRFHRSYQAETRAQDRLNRRALIHWLDYLDSLADAAIVPPTAQQLTRRRGPARELDPVRTPGGRVVPGVAELDAANAAPIVVASAETVSAVSEAFSRVGLPHGADSTGRAAYACGGLVARAWGAGAAPIPPDSMAQWRELRPAPLAEIQVGDVVVLGHHDTGLTGSGIYVGEGDVIVTDARDGQSVVRKLADQQVYGVRRPALPPRHPKAAPDIDTCGLIESDTDAAPAGSGPLLLPVADGSYTLSSGFGDSGHLWSTGEHSGQDFAAPLGTPVHAAAAGTVTTEKSGWAGTLVRIDHGAGVETWYAHMSQVAVVDGETVVAGDVIGGVGSEGNSTGAHLHFEIRLDASSIDPMAVLVPTAFSATGTFTNGELAESTLCAATLGGTQLLRCDAAVGFRMMGAAYEAALGTPLCITDSYRPRAIQEEVFTSKPGLAAVPGTSNHGWGVAVDLCGGIERFGTPQHEWVSSNGPTYGWVLPDWAAQDGSKPEPWHFEYAA